MMITILKDDGPIVGYQQVVPEVVRDGEVARIDARDIYYKQLNETIRGAFSDGVKTIVLDHVNGQRYLGTGIGGTDRRIEVHGTAGNDLAMFMDGPTVEVFGNAQDGVGNTMNEGTVIIHGDAGDVLGYGMRGGTVLIEGDVGYRVGIHMKAYEKFIPVMVCGGKARDFFGEYMAGGLLVLLGLNSRIEGALAGSFLATGMHGGAVYVRGEVEPWQCGKEVGIFEATDEDKALLKPHIEKWCEAFGSDVGEVLGAPFTKLVPVSNRPYGKLYAY